MKRSGLSIVLVMSLLGAIIALPTASALDDINGIWLTHGYGMLLTVDGDQVAIFDITPVSCTPLFDQSILEELGIQYRIENGELLIHDGKSVYITAGRLDALPEMCADGGTVSDDPELNFEAFWHDFNDHYMFFDLHGVDWQAQYDRYRSLVTASTTPDELFTILSEMISPLDDDHIVFTNGQDDFSPALAPSWNAAEYSELGVMLSTLDVIAANYLGGQVTFNPFTFTLDGDEALIANQLVFYGAIGNVGYVNILAEYGYSEDEDVVVAAEATMDQIMAAFAGLDAVIVDVRLNMGGDDMVALTLASRFADQRRLAWTEYARDGDGFTPARDVYVEPDGPLQFTGPVFVLTTPYTVSAGETFLLAMDVLPHVTVIGERTAGAYSDVLSRVLPNGWEFTLSNEAYLNAEGESYEKIGNSPDIEVAYDLESLLAGTDMILDAALELAAP